MFDELVTLFSEMGWISATLLTLGIIFAVIEVFTPGLGVSALVSSICIVGGIVARMIEGGNFTQLLILIFIFIAIFLVLFLIMVRSAKYGILAKTPIVESGTAIPKDYSNAENNPLYAYTGKIGVAINDLQPIGSVSINDKIFDAIALSSHIEKGASVEIMGNNSFELIVRKIDKD